MCFQLRDALSVGSIVFSKEFFSMSHGIREIKSQLEDELVRRLPILLPYYLSNVCTCVRREIFACSSSRQKRRLEKVSAHAYLHS